MLLGRIDTQVKVRGHRVEPAEIEAALNACPGVRAATVALRPDHTGQPWLVAYVVGEMPPPTAGTLRDALAARLPVYMVPQRFVLLDALPLTANGKVNVQALPPPPAERPALAVACVAPRGPVEALVAAAWRAVLRIEPVGIRDDFLDLGGDSLLGMRIVTLLQERLGCELPVETLLTKTEAVEAMAEVIVNALAPSNPDPGSRPFA